MKGLEKSALSVSAVALFISDLVKDQLGPVLIKGEISNLQLRPNSSYIRFSLKDSTSKIDCLTYQSSNAARLLAHLQNGDEVIIFAQPSYYKKYGQISFFTDEMMKIGEGIFHSNLDKLKQKLYEEGLFNEDRKKSLPEYPTHIGIVTSADGAALQDIIRIARDRFPLVTISVFPSLVQGKEAPVSLYKAVSTAINKKLDAIIIGRGGGSSEDLDAFNDEKLIRLIATSPIPVISAVGHEIDSSLSDFVADVSAPTPTGAAMILLPDKSELLQELSLIKNRLHSDFTNLFNEEKKQLEILKNSLTLKYKTFIEHSQQELKLLALKLHENNPEYIINKGFAALMTPEHEIIEHNQITIKTKNRTIYATINKIETY